MLGSVDWDDSFLNSPAIEALANAFGSSTPGAFADKTFGPYKTTKLLGMGGMGEVYRARDTRLGRDVAVKVLPPQFSADPERVIRSEREAKLLASLNHPNIAAIYDIQESDDGIRCLILEFVEGQTLSARLRQGGLRIEEALEICRQIAEALEAAHEKQIVHRDLKPANVIITPQGKVKVLDFGIAKMLEPQAPASATSAPTLSAAMVLGTPSYMSPEQARGQNVDKRTDIWAFGCVLYESLTNRQAFTGATSSDAMAQVLDRQPDWEALPASTPARIRDLLQRCLQKDPRRRLHDIADARIEIEEAAASANAATAGVPAATALSRRSAPRAPISWLWMGLVGVLAVALAAALLVRYPSSIDAERRLEIWTGETADPAGFAVSPDGRQLVYVASGSAGSQLWLRPLGADRAVPLAKTQGASYPFWSPNSQSIGFFAEGQLMRQDLVSGVTTRLAAAPLPFGGSWGPDSILYAPLTGGNVFRILPSGGEPMPVLTQPQTFNLFPVFLGAGPTFLFTGNRPRIGVHLARLGSSESNPLLPNVTAAALHPSGYMLLVRQGALLAQRFDMAAGKMVGNEVPVTDGIQTGALAGAALSVSASGVVAYRRGQTRRQLVFFDRSGRPTGRIGGEASDLRWPAISKEGRIAFQKIAGGQVWVTDTETSAPTQFTFGPEPKRSAIWSPNGLWIAFRSTSADGGVHSVRRKRSNGTGVEDTLLREFSGVLSDWYGTSILLDKPVPPFSGDIEVLASEGSHESHPYLANPSYTERRGKFSHNGKWVAYESDESGRFEIYVRPFPDPSKCQKKVSTDGGTFALWSWDDRELYYLSPAGILMAVPVNTSGDIFSPGSLMSFFPHGLSRRTWTSLYPYGVSKDGRFLMRVPAEDELSPITVLLNWSPDKK